MDTETRAVDRLAMKLDRFSPMSPAERAVLRETTGHDLRRFSARSLIVERGATGARILLMVEGWACRYVLGPDGRRRIVAFHLPGDIVELDVDAMPSIDQSVASVGMARVAAIEPAAMEGLMRAWPDIGRRLRREAMLAASIQRAWTINIGHRLAKHRLAHLFCELHLRAALVGMAQDGACPLPLTQTDLADACAMTAIHTNRALQQIRRDGLLSLENGVLTIHDFAGLAAMAQFDPGYLHLPR